MSSVDQTEPALNIIWPMFISLENSLLHAEQCEPMLTKIWPVFISLAIDYHLPSNADLC